MKRSKMINKMLETSKTLHGMPATGEDFPNFELTLINLLLDTVEKEGMVLQKNNWDTIKIDWSDENNPKSMYFLKDKEVEQNINNVSYGWEPE